jgi:hypothetical protein
MIASRPNMLSEVTTSICPLSFLKNFIFNSLLTDPFEPLPGETKMSCALSLTAAECAHSQDRSRLSPAYRLPQKQKPDERHTQGEIRCLPLKKLANCLETNSNTYVQEISIYPFPN